jgi:subtilisin-like proprotein convertase family protein
MRLVVARLALTGLVAGFVSLVSPATTAVAVPVPCVVTTTGTGGAVAAAGDTFVTTSFELVAPPSTANVEDVDVEVSLVHDNASQVRVRLAHATTSILQRRFVDSGPQVRPLTWDDEAASAYGPTSLAGAYRPDEPLAEHDGTAAQGQWRLLVDNWAGFRGRLESWSVRVTYTSCDADDDGAEDHTDNCTGVANPDQADRDADGIGDACDGDTDGDGRVDTVDGCRLVAAATATGCPRVGTKVRLGKVKGRLVGRVRADVRACRSGAEVTLKRAKPGRDLKLVVLRARTSGRFTTRLPRAAGRYYVVVRGQYAPGVAECGSSRSTKVRVRR